MRLNDPAVVRDQYATEANLRARQALYEDVEGPDPREVAWDAIVAANPRRLLEVGGGPGELSERVARELRTEVAYLDISPRMVELARARGIENAHAGDVQKLPFADSSFDTAVAAWMLFHVPDLDRGLAELARVLQRRGRLVAVTNGGEHLRELHELFGTGVFEVGFTRENGADLLRRYFASVEQHDVDGWVTVQEREKLVAYRNSLSTADELGELAELDLPLRIRRASTVFVAAR